MPEAALPSRWGVPQAALYATLPSALDTVHAAAARNGPAGAVVLAVEQTAGRGRDGRTWRSPPGGVWLGLLLRPPRADACAVAIRAGLALVEAVDALLGSPLARLKWPNDVVLGDRKLAGILCETRWHGDTLQWLALGVGVNVANPIPLELAERAVALGELLPGVRRLDLLDRLVPALLRGAGQGARLSETELRAFAARDWLRGRQLRRPVAGRAAGLAPDGALLVDLGGGRGTTPVSDGRVELA